MKLLVALASMLVLSYRLASVTERPDFERYFTEKKLKGSFLLYDPQRDHYTAYNFERTRQRFLPASTYKILNTLIGLETGVLKDEHSVMKWDSVKRDIETWNRDHTLETAFKASCVPCYQEVARNVGVKRMQEWVGKTGYGKMDINADNLDRFWLEGKSGISQEEQIDFLRRVHEGNVPFSKRNQAILKKIMLIEEKQGVKLYGKTGWAAVEPNIGWFVGYVEKGDKVYYFATNVESPKPVPDTFIAARREITETLLKQLGVL
ncbi:beta-lactamase class D [Larkinella arboricola]|uniref:beta-lactamase n=1 Tax=Larkinella arboricola TaxID=643671 RepID=A0A327X630_LARAB|nr:class D beta-lactamase [Larkinella arboricola]RAK02395.1 beta-lactamase class D [Larkinella arboricola]